MTIRNVQAFVDALWDWGILEGCFGTTGIAPTDVDGLVERNGHFLLLEAKGPGVPLKRGQSRTLEALIATGCFTVLVVWGTPGKPERVQIFPEPPMDANLKVFCGIVEMWFDLANEGRSLGAPRAGRKK